MRRKLYLINEHDEPFYLDDIHKVAIEEMDGLGFSFQIDYEDYDARYIETKRTIPQGKINLSLIFFDGYNGFLRWREYISKSKTIRLIYLHSNGEKYCYINVVSSSKSQLESGIIRSKVELEMLSLWLVDKSGSITVTETDGGKVYPYTYSYEYSLSFNGSFTVINNSARKVPLLVRMIGNLYYPRVIVKQNGEEICSLRLLIDEREHPTIEVNSEPTNQYIRRYIGVDSFDLYNDQDFSYDNFLYLPPGESEIFFDPGVREIATCVVEYQEQYIAH